MLPCGGPHARAMHGCIHAFPGAYLTLPRELWYDGMDSPLRKSRGTARATAMRNRAGAARP
jgi:hypothetical protein